MRIKRLFNFRVLSGILIAASITSCGNSNSNVSTATGWKINDSKGGFQYNTKYEQKTPNGMVAVEGGTFTMGQVQDDIMSDWNNSPKQMYVQSFYMDETETTNIMYNEYLYWLRTVFPQNNEIYKEIYNSALPDTTVWRSASGFNEALITTYLRHPAYANYPVVGVSWLQATDFAKWRTDRVNELALEKAGYLKKDAKIVEAYADAHFSTDTYLMTPSQVYGGNSDIVYRGKDNKAAEGDRNLYATQNYGLFTSQFRLPTEAEWEYAAIGLIGNREYNNYKGRKTYPWDKSGKRKKGKPVPQNTKYANFKQGRGDYGGIAGWSTDNGDITNAVKSYPPNDFGLYDMAGNVAEWVADVYDPAVDQNDTDFNFYKGNVYYKNKIGPDGKLEIVTDQSVQFDTLSTGKLRVRNLPGQIAQEVYDPAIIDEIVQTGLGGRSPEDKPKTKERTALYDSKSRVIKGGSWKDRAYWLDPATRRFYAEDQSTDYIGFRLIMTKVGPKSDKRKTKN
ncbi:gliding motility lipoprotein GldJ [Myroides phaeus]|uniref:Gliding motility-associated lipoprotein GldJ n=1 Tax=Myroides phaeus TaxID=702745 RepID=A0A1G8F841_9FLAO|nr:gliding motility lipoprotein GldJ [Myroides phaeus]MEC4116874.1 gliding motility lipoprotein GldJ [Myroides phaeus]SDH78302.1 gliding motility-associated lipoprotein GldJ [Myroides phaeus]